MRPGHKNIYFFYLQDLSPQDAADILSQFISRSDMLLAPQTERPIISPPPTAGNDLKTLNDEFSSFLKALSASNNVDPEPRDVVYPQVQQQQRKITDLTRSEYAKEDRQGYYSDPYYGKDIGYQKQIYENQMPQQVPVKTVGIRISPLNILRSLLNLLPKPIFNLNGKLFLGLELGKNVGLATGTGQKGNSQGNGARFFVKY